MRFYTVHYRRRSLDPDRDLVLVKDGFSWPAFLLSGLWSLGSGLWAVTGLIVLAHLATSFLAASLDLGQAGQLGWSLVLALGFGLFGNEMKRWTLARRGFALAGVVGGENAEAAERSFLIGRPDILVEMAA